jgi:hypothetical protein
VKGIGEGFMWIASDPAAMNRLAAELRRLYPSEYSPERREERQLPASVARDSILMSHTLLPDVMLHAFSTHAALMSPDLPLSRAQHEMIATVVSATNRCFY